MLQSVPKAAVAWVGCLLGAPLLLGGASGCTRDEGGGELHARLSTLEREAEGLRVSLGKLERGEPIIPADAVAVGVSEAVIKEFLDAQLPFEADAERFKVRLSQGEAIFRGSPAVRLAGSIWPSEHPDLVGEVRIQGALEGIKVEHETGTLRATLVLDHVDLVQMGGLEKYIPGGSLNELARAVRKELEPRLPPVQIPVTIEQSVELPSVTDGPVLIQGARMPLEVAVADVFAGRGNLWVAIRVVPGELTKTAAAARQAAPAPTAAAPKGATPKPTAPSASPGGHS
jgi:hypothetical protein